MTDPSLDYVQIMQQIGDRISYLWLTQLGNNLNQRDKVPFLPLS